MSVRKIACSILILILSIFFTGCNAISAPSPTPPPLPEPRFAFVANLFSNSFSGAAASASVPSGCASQMGSNGIQYGSSSQSNSSATVLCSTRRSPSGKSYISGFFPAGNQDHTVFEVAFDNYIYTKLDTQGRGTICVIYPSVAKAQFALERWKQEEKAGAGSHHLVETGWVYQGPNAALGYSQGNQGSSPGQYAP